jgi:hypothetical protein
MACSGAWNVEDAPGVSGRAGPGPQLGLDDELSRRASAGRCEVPCRGKHLRPDVINRSLAQ